MDDEDEDFERLFFEECRELLGTLQDHLNQLADGTGDDETVHAAFRAVHSVKGGAAAFGFDQLIAFAHIFETVMDLIRSDKLEPNQDIYRLLLRSGDMMEVLVEGAQAGTTVEDPRIDALREDLEGLAMPEGAPLASGAVEPAADSGAFELFDPASGKTAAGPDAIGDATEPDGNAAPQTLARDIVVSIAPDEDFLVSGHDPLRLIRSARGVGLVGVAVHGQLPPIGEFDHRICPMTWELTFSADRSVDDIEAFFDIYCHAAVVSFIDDGRLLESDVVLEDLAELTASMIGQVFEEQTRPEIDGSDTVAEPVRQAADGAAKSRGSASKSLRVELHRIDRLVNLVGEMLITQAGLAQRLLEVEGNESTEMGHSVDAMSRQLRELQESVMAIRAQPVKSVFSRMPRVVRDLAEKLGKEARLELEGENTEVDATVIEELAEPLTHMLRNSMDHGLEDTAERIRLGKPRIGTIRLSAEHRGERVIITVEDDGRGVNRERVRVKAIERGLISAEDMPSPEEIDALIFHPGFSTATEISSVSGRGVGMDVVKKKIVSLGGRCALESTPGKGTRFEITLPLTLAVMDGMTIVVGGQKFILPLSSVVEALHIDKIARKHLPNGDSLLERRGEFLRLIDLRAVLASPADHANTDMAIVVDTETNGLVALIVDELIGQRQIVLKSLEANFRRVEGISGATILGDGQVALILDVPSLLHMTGSSGHYQEMMQ